MRSRSLPFRLLVLALIAATAVFASAASAEMPQNRDAPTITGDASPVVGQTLLGNNGTWLYADGSSCRSECQYTFAWFRCGAGGDCAPIPGGRERAYRVAPADAGRGLRVAVTATKHDCNAHGQDCRLVSRTAVSSQTPPVAAPVPPPLKLTIARVAVDRAPRGRLVVSVRVTDGEGRAVGGARVTVRGGSAVTGSTGAARVTVRARSVALTIRAERAGAEPAVLEVRLR
jgi:hypothetical protein